MLFVGSHAIARGNGTPFGGGLHCAGGTIVRLGFTTTGAQGTASWGQEFGDLGGWAAGDSRVFQVWYRDPTGGPCGTVFNTLNALQICF
ncbi:MAG TPA: hypothetical protein QF764_05045 [Planctomycetota bacterium]|nr:hypothetical protein [Planctomycetota bacterium]